MKQNIFRNIISFCVIAAIAASQASVAFAQVENPTARSLYNYPSSAIVGSTVARHNAYAGLTETEKAAAATTLQQMVANATQGTAGKPQSLNLSLVDELGTSTAVSASASTATFSGFSNKTSAAACTDCTSSRDADSDGLIDKLEQGLANGFTPLYHVSAGENSGTGFSTFNDSVPQTIDQTFGSTPPISYFRVKPLGVFIKASDGLPYGLIQINYMTIWNKDNGLVAGGLCLGYPFISTVSIGAHNLDNEWSALLVAAPVVAGGYDPIKSNYKVYEAYTAAHQGTFFDQSMHYDLSTPFPIDSHIVLYLSKSKHATYAGNPDYYPLTPMYVIISVYDSLDLAYATGQISWVTYLALLAAADDTFFACIVDRFQEQGGVFADANKRINVGELTQPLHASHFIQDTELTGQLNQLFY